MRQGKCVIVVDDEGRENEGDLIASAQLATPETLNLMMREARGLVCAPMASQRAEALGLPPMVAANKEAHCTAFTVSVDARNGVTTGISAADRARTANILADPNSKASDLVRPGHLFPLAARSGGVLQRAGHTEAAVDLCKLAGLQPVGIICEIINDDGTMARRPQLAVFAEQHGLKIISVKQIISYRHQHERLVTRVVETALPTAFGKFRAICYTCETDNRPYLALVLGELDAEPTLVRVHSSCLTGDVFHSLRCDCGDQLHRALEMIQEEGKGVLLYIDQEGRGIGLANKLRAYALQDKGADTVEANEMLGFPADLRDYGIGAQVLADLGLRKLRLMTNNPKKIIGLEGYGLEIIEAVPICIPPNPYNERYLQTKHEKMGHMFSAEEREKVVLK
ncbi:MAG TPA: bifunctional 3,4-dihydroxy-2-butanone-4-phosphate synthase/GTP cyclohydrolase II [Armatimonadota bacterium]|nr:bifunctional 3,4-dihydroxy-2-butanone-4-phosphate synthase/GTP cyclohydrolase II [Armatimonadota bacterium]